MTLQSARTFRGMISIVEERAAESPPPSCFRYGKGKYHIPAAVTHNTVPGKKGPRNIAIAGVDNIFPVRLAESTRIVTGAGYAECAQQEVPRVLFRDHENKTS